MMQPKTFECAEATTALAMPDRHVPPPKDDKHVREDSAPAPGTRSEGSPSAPKEEKSTTSKDERDHPTAKKEHAVPSPKEGKSPPPPAKGDAAPPPKAEDRPATLAKGDKPGPHSKEDNAPSTGRVDSPPPPAKEEKSGPAGKTEHPSSPQLKEEKAALTSDPIPIGAKEEKIGLSIKPEHSHISSQEEKADAAAGKAEPSMATPKEEKGPPQRKSDPTPTGAKEDKAAPTTRPEPAPPSPPAAPTLPPPASPPTTTAGPTTATGDDRFESGAPEEIPPEVLNQRICDFHLRLEGSPLESVIARFQKELETVGIVRLQPRFYLSDEWGVNDGSVAIALPFYLADERLRRIQEKKGGIVEGSAPEDILRYLRHEMGHVVNYAYRLYETEEWTSLFGPMARPYVDTYRSVPFSPDFVRHLPGNYAQKHPDDDWAETFAVWMTPGLDWRDLYSDAPGALRKLEYCDRIIKTIRNQDPAVTIIDVEGKVDDLVITLQEFYGALELDGVSLPRSLDGDLRGIFSPWAQAVAGVDKTRRGSGAALLRRNLDLIANTVYGWTGVDSGLLCTLLAHLAKRAETLGLTYPMAERDTVLMQVTAFLTTLAMNYSYKGTFIAT